MPAFDPRETVLRRLNHAIGQSELGMNPKGLSPAQCEILNHNLLVIKQILFGAKAEAFVPTQG